MESSKLEQFKILYTNTLIVIDFYKDLDNARASMISSFEDNQLRSKLISESNKAKAIKQIGSSENKTSVRNIEILGLSLTGLKQSVIAKLHNITPARVKQIINSELARFKHPRFQNAISSAKILNIYKVIINDELRACPSNETAQEMNRAIVKFENLQKHILRVRELSATNVI